MSQMWSSFKAFILAVRCKIFLLCFKQQQKQGSFLLMPLFLCLQDRFTARALCSQTWVASEKVAWPTQLQPSHSFLLGTFLRMEMFNFSEQVFIKWHPTVRFLRKELCLYRPRIVTGSLCLSFEGSSYSLVVVYDKNKCMLLLALSVRKNNVELIYIIL